MAAKQVEGFTSGRWGLGQWAEGCPRVSSRDEPVGPDCAAWCAPFVAEGIGRYVSNESTARMEIVPVGGAGIPVVVNDGGSRGCYLTSPSCHYCAYAADAVEAKMQSRGVGRLGGLALRGLGLWARRRQLDRVASVNNWMLSTNPAPTIGPREVRELTASLGRRFPDHALVFRTVERGRGTLAEDLEAAGWWRMPNRLVFRWDPDRVPKLGRKCRQTLRRERQAIAEHGYRSVPVGEAVRGAGVARIRELYRDLYVGKHSRWNPDFTLPWFAHAAVQGWMRWRCLARDGRVDGFSTWYEEADRITAMVLGYDRTMTDVPLYRMLVADVLAEGERCGKPVFLSSGAGRFKELRGAEARWEFEYVYDEHLRRARRAPWRALEVLYERLAGGFYAGGNF